ncbi:Btb/Poz Domain-Containing Protein Kctd8 [Manis pentadactyla]|nr:Btb/Poz Domain-Containing Protein Kctd8 [Manis pentadactyla]
MVKSRGRSNRARKVCPDIVNGRKEITTCTHEALGLHLPDHENSTRKQEDMELITPYSWCRGIPEDAFVTQRWPDLYSHLRTSWKIR